jgi:hypothetical protein
VARHFGRRNEPIAGTSIGEVSNHSCTSWGMRTIGWPRVNEVFPSTGTPVRA